MNQGFIELPRTARLGRVLSCGTWLVLLLGLGWFVTGTFGCVSRDGYLPPNRALLPYVPIAVLLAAVLFALRARFHAQYLLDTEQRKVILRSRSWGKQRSRVLLEGTDVSAVTVQARKAGHNRAIRWEYRAVAVGMNGGQVALTDWLCDGLDGCNATGARLALALACPFHKAPPKSESVIRVQGGTVSIDFVPARWGMTRFDRWVYLILGLVIAALILLALLAIGSAP